MEKRKQARPLDTRLKNDKQTLQQLSFSAIYKRKGDMMLKHYNHPHRLQVYTAHATRPSQDLIVIWKDGRLRDIETGHPIELAQGAEAVITEIEPSQAYKRTA